MTFPEMNCVHVGPNGTFRPSGQHYSTPASVDGIRRPGSVPAPSSVGPPVGSVHAHGRHLTFGGLPHLVRIDRPGMSTRVVWTIVRPEVSAGVDGL